MATSKPDNSNYWTGAASEPAQTIDPAWYWADITDYQGYRQRSGGRVRVAIELRAEAEGPALLTQLDQLAASVTAVPPALQIAPHYRGQLTAQRTRFFTVRVMPALLVPLSKLGLRRIKLGLIGRQAGLAGTGADPLKQDLQAGELDSSVLRERAVQQLGRSRRDKAASIKGLEFFAQLQRPPPATERRARDESLAPLIAVIDFGCAFAHPAFRAQGDLPATRVRHFWDQGRSDRVKAQKELRTLWPWQRPKDFAYGLEATGAKLDALMQGVYAYTAQGHAPERFEQGCYVAAGLPELLQPWSHGTAVLGLAAGWPHAYHQPDLQPDAAASAEIAFVQLPSQAVDDLSGGWVTPYVLDALSYLMARRNGRPLVINLCIGSHAGPHDGDSLLEAALDACAAVPGVTVVLAAGNAAGKMGHAVAQIKPGQSATLQWVLPAGDATPSFLELWYERPADGPAPEVSVAHPAVVSVSSQGGQAHPIQRTSGTGPPVGALVNLPQTRAGRNTSGMAMLALGPTASSKAAAGGLPIAPAGTWSVMVTNPSRQTLEVHAWIERDEPGASNGPQPPSSVLMAPLNLGFKLSDENTLTAQATGGGTVVVGGYLLGWPGTQPTPFPAPSPASGRGPSRRGGRSEVDVLAPSDLWSAGYVRGIPALANLSLRPGVPPRGLDSEGRAGLSGTSLAAPWVARLAFNALVDSPGLLTRDALLTALRAQPPAPPPLHWLT